MHYPYTLSLSLLYPMNQVMVACPCPSKAPAKQTLSVTIMKTALAVSPTSPPSLAHTSSTSNLLTSMCQDLHTASRLVENPRLKSQRGSPVTKRLLMCHMWAVSVSSVSRFQVSGAHIHTHTYSLSLSLSLTHTHTHTHTLHQQPVF